MTFRAEKTPFLINRMQLLIGILLLMMGSMIYMTDRAPEYVYFTRFFGIHVKLFSPDTHILGSLGLRLPAFFHVLSFSLISAAFMTSSKKNYSSVCAGWFVINFCFEMGQKYKHTAAGITPDFFDYLPFFDNTRAYFLNGTFDWMDILAAAAGAIVAYLTLLATKTDHMSSA